MNSCSYCDEKIRDYQRRVCTAFLSDGMGGLFYTDETFSGSEWYHKRCAKKMFKLIKKQHKEALYDEQEE